MTTAKRTGPAGAGPGRVGPPRGPAGEGAKSRRRPPHRRPRLATAGGKVGGARFGLLLVVLVAIYLTSAFLVGTGVAVLQIVLLAAVASLAVRSGGLRRHTAGLAIAAAFGGSLVALTLAITHPADAVTGVANLWAALILLFTVVLIVRRVLDFPVVTIQSIYGAVSAYMVLGLMFAAVYAAMYRFGGNSFFAHGETGNVKTFQYFSFTTLTTLGYGDYTAARSSGQALAVVEAMAGQIFLATLVARLVATFRTSTRTERREGPGRPRRRTARPRPERARPGWRARAASAAAARGPMARNVPAKPARRRGNPSAGPG